LPLRYTAPGTILPNIPRPVTFFDGSAPMRYAYA
jgi:hypothetical protein